MRRFFLLLIFINYLLVVGYSQTLEFFNSMQRINSEDGGGMELLFVGAGNIQKSFNIGTNIIRFHGFEIDMGFRLKNIEARVSIPNLFPMSVNVPELSRVQFITSISFIGGFPMKIE